MNAPDELTERFAAARLWAASRAPYLASALFALNPLVHDPGPPGGLRGLPADAHWNVHLDPATVLGTPVPELGWWLIHQVGHLLRAHHTRAPTHPPAGEPTTSETTKNRTATSGTTDHEPVGGGRGQESAWARAADAEINDDLGDLGPEPADAVTPDTLGLPPGLLAERYLELLDLVDVPGHLAPCGRAPFTGPGAMTALERELLARAVAAEIEARGNVPGGWRRWAEHTLRPEVDWRARLGALVRRALAQAAGRVDHSYRRPSRRAAAVPELVLPALVRPVPRIAVVVDTSGSVSRADLGRTLAELGGVLRAAGHRRLDVICCDTQAYPVQRVTAASQVRLIGAGGTDLRPGIAAATGGAPSLRSRTATPPTSTGPSTHDRTTGPGADLVIVLTDGHTPWPERRPRCPVVVCLFGEGATVPSWASVARVRRAA
ncbi:VWA-like domain-containing protein [Nonomuraea sp. NPDC049714]|uniref:vWA domain-containing protein n=1 Tax=Nonomuraea sp. NPDC049714 TaxID=3364357 RepID=UPI0037A2E62A